VKALIIIAPLLLGDVITLPQVCNWLGVCNQQLAVPGLDGGNAVYAQIITGAAAVDTNQIGGLSGTLTITAAGNLIEQQTSTQVWASPGFVALAIDGGQRLCLDFYDGGCLFEAGNVLTIAASGGGSIVLSGATVVDAGLSSLYGFSTDAGFFLNVVADGGFYGNLNAFNALSTYAGSETTINGTFQASSGEAITNGSLTNAGTFQSDSGIIPFLQTNSETGVYGFGQATLTFVSGQGFNTTTTVVAGSGHAGLIEMVFDGGRIASGTAAVIINLPKAGTIYGMPDAGWTIDCHPAPGQPGMTVAQYVFPETAIQPACSPLDAGSFAVYLEPMLSGVTGSSGWDGGAGQYNIQYLIGGW
jgi:hypothetical protein